MKKNLLAITGVFMPYNDTITQMTYKHLCKLNYNIDVVSFKAKSDESILKELKQDKNYDKFNINYVDADFTSVNIHRDNLNILKAIINIRKLLKKSKKISNIKSYDILYSNSMPNYTHYAAYRIKKKLASKITWYASFSDPIINNPYINNLKKKNIFMYILQKIIFYKKKYQKNTLKYADKLIFMSEELRDFVIGTDKELLKKSIVIPITYISDWSTYKFLIESKPKFNKDTINFMHFGNIYGLREIEKFLIALKELKEEHSNIMKNIKIHQYGSIEPEKRNLIYKYGLDDVFIINSKVDYNKCLELMQNRADVLIIFDTILPDGDIQPFLPSKILEYLLTRKPIYSITSFNSPTYRMLNEKHICARYDVADIKNTILKQIKQIKVVNNNFRIYDNDYVIDEKLGNELDVK